MGLSNSFWGCVLDGSKTFGGSQHWLSNSKALEFETHASNRRKVGTACVEKEGEVFGLEEEKVGNERSKLAVHGFFFWADKVLVHFV